MKLWSKGRDFDHAVEQFTVGDDYILDQELIPHDCKASFAHGKMLNKIGVINNSELESIKEGLKEIINLHAKNNFVISAEQEDCHTAIENFLVAHYGEAGKKIHTARSRNDQVLVALRMYMKDNILKVLRASLNLTQQFALFAKTYAQVPIPGRTHMQLAMPSSLGLWAGAIGESLIDDGTGLQHVYSVIDQCPLGSASSYGVNIGIDRQMVSDLLAFKKVQNNVLYANNSRGKFEALVINSLHQIMLSLNKASCDIMFFSLPEIGYLKLPENLCSGSSLMPQKHNPCALELIRAKSSTVASLHSRVDNIIRSLPSGYHRDFQETKAALMQAFNIVIMAIKIISKHLDGLEVNESHCIKAFRPEVFATDHALLLTSQGMPFRDAYLNIASSLDNLALADPQENIASKTHIGAPGNLQLELITKSISDKTKWLEEELLTSHTSIDKELGLIS